MKGTNKIELSTETVEEIFQAWVDATFGDGKVRVDRLEHGYFGTMLTLKDPGEKPIPAAPEAQAA